ncbi:MAG: ribokinase [Chloroflexota bacterium]
MGKIIVLGSINMDVVVTAPRHPQIGETIFGNEVHFIPGGKGSNQAVAAARLDGEVQLIGKLGEDAFGNELEQFLSSEKLDLKHLSRSASAPTGTAMITVNHDSENTIIVISGSNMEITPADVQNVVIRPDTVLVSQFEVPQNVLYVLTQKARDAGAKTVLNPAPAGPFIDGLLDTIDYLVVNETELAYFAAAPLTEDIDELTTSAKKLRTRRDQTIIVTLGANGLLCVQDEDVTIVEGRKTNALDTTGAGDCFVGALAVALSEGMALIQALQFANRAAAISVTRLGASSSMPYRHELE